MSVFNSVSRPLVVLIILLMLVSLVTGLTLSGAEILRPYTGHRMEVETDALAGQMKAQANANARIAAVQAEEAARLAAAKTEAESNVIRVESEARIAVIQADAKAQIARIEEDLRAQTAHNTQTLEAESEWARAKVILVFIFGLVICAALARLLFSLATRIAGAMTVRHRAVAVPAIDRWQDPAYRAWAIARARRHECEARSKVVRQTPMSPEHTRDSGNGHTHPVPITQPEGSRREDENR